MDGPQGRDRARGRRRDPHRLREGLHPRPGLLARRISSSYGSEAAIKAAGKLRMEGKEYVVQDGDIMHFLFNV